MKLSPSHVSAVATLIKIHQNWTGGEFLSGYAEEAEYNPGEIVLERIGHQGCYADEHGELPYYDTITVWLKTDPEDGSEGELLRVDLDDTTWIGAENVLIAAGKLA